jgi:hypothetical protein
MNSYREKLSPSWWMVVATGLVVPATTLIFLPLSIPLGLGAGALLWLGSLGLLWALSPTITIDAIGIRAGRAQIDRTFVSAIEPFWKEDARAHRGVLLDARAWLVLRPWVDPVLKITIADPEDPTPYWLVSIKNPEQFLAAWKAGSTT